VAQRRVRVGVQSKSRSSSYADPRPAIHLQRHKRGPATVWDLWNRHAGTDDTESRSPGRRLATPLRWRPCHCLSTGQGSSCRRRREIAASTLELRSPLRDSDTVESERISVKCIGADDTSPLSPEQPRARDCRQRGDSTTSRRSASMRWGAKPSSELTIASAGPPVSEPRWLWRPSAVRAPHGGPPLHGGCAGPTLPFRRTIAGAWMTAISGSEALQSRPKARVSRATITSCPAPASPANRQSRSSQLRSAAAAARTGRAARRSIAPG
jgi:hypothetical protein